MFDASHLPGLDAPHRDPAVQGPDAARWTVPKLDPADIVRIAAGLRTRSDTLRSRPIAHIVLAIDAVARRFADTADPVRRTAETLLPAITGYAPSMVRSALDRMADDWRAPASERLLAAEFADPRVLDGFVHEPTRRSRVHALGPDLAVHVLAGNIPGVAPTSLVRALLVKAPSLARLSRGEPVLAPLFARTLAEIDPELGHCLAVTWWDRGDSETLRAALRHAGAVIAYGGGDAIDAVRSATPVGTPVLDHGPRISFGAVSRTVLHDETAAGALAGDIARATALFDQQGCVSPQLVYVEEGGAVSPAGFARLVAHALEALADELPRGSVDPAAAAAIHDLRAEAEFRQIAGEETAVFASEDTRATVVWERDPAFAGTPLNRVLRVKSIPDLAALPGIVAPYGSVLQTAALAGGTDALAQRLAQAGVTRITTFQEMAFPPPFWHHDGRGPLRELVRWTDWER